MDDILELTEVRLLFQKGNPPMISETKKRGKRLIFIGALFAAICAFWTYSLIQNERNDKIRALEAIPQFPLKPYLYAAVEIPQFTPFTTSPRDVLGEYLTDDELKARITPSADICPNSDNDSLPVGLYVVCLVEATNAVSQSMVELTSITAGDFSSPEDAMPLVLAELQTKFGDTDAMIDILVGEPISERYFGEAQGTTIGEKMRAVTIGVNAITNVDNRVTEGDRVDIFVSFTQDEGEGLGVPTTALLFQDVEVLGASNQEQRFPSLPNGYISSDSDLISSTTVTLELPVIDAAQLTCMENFAQEVRLVLRNPEEKQVLDTTPVTLCASNIAS